MKLTDVGIRRVNGNGKVRKLSDGGGLFLYVTPTGKKSWRIAYTKEQMTFHGFRSMASTLLNERGYNRDWIERQLAHSERNGVRTEYNYAEYLPERRRMMQEWADYLDELRVSVSGYTD